MDASQVLDRDFLEIRAKLLEVAAALDRIDRADGSVAGDSRMEQLNQALARLVEGAPGCAEALQQIFSRPYDAGWREAWRI